VIDMLAALDLATGRMHAIAEAVGRLVWAFARALPDTGCRA
jgi:hypothetical protein